METPVEYRVDKPLYPQSNPQEQILNSSYFKVVASLAQASLVGGLIEPEEIAEHSINLTDQLIAKVSQKLNPDSTTKP
ncbi:MAG: hypothetical protein AAGA80_28450 [Cyanobacteria bacterium P01_F01_bin.143]